MNDKPYQIGTRVETPDGHGAIISESKVGEFMIHIDGGGMVYYFDDDLNLEQEEDDDET